MTVFIAFNDRFQNRYFRNNPHVLNPREIDRGDRSQVVDQQGSAIFAHHTEQFAIVADGFRWRHCICLPSAADNRHHQPVTLGLSFLVCIRMNSKTSGISNYWQDAQRPLTCLLFLLPLIAVYEIGVWLIAGSEAGSIRNGADYWMRSWLSAWGLGQWLLLPTLVIVVLLSWHLIRKHPWRVNPETMLGMSAESVLLAVVLMAVGQVHQLLFLSLASPEAAPTPLMLATGDLSRAISFVGAGVYEEVLFRLLLLPVVYGGFRILECPPKFSAAMAAISTAFVFALAHHVGPNADAFNAFAFSFRLAAGTFFAAIFLLRGFGITVGCHAAYDLLVGVFLVAPITA